MATLVVNIDRNRLQFYGGNLSSILSLDIPATIVRDQDIVNKDEFYTLVKQWVKQYNVVPTSMFCVFSENTYFDKFIPAGDETKTETEILKFFDLIPFDSIWTKVLPAPKGHRAVAINKAYYEAIRHAFALQGFIQQAAIPAFALGDALAKRVFDAEVGAYVVKNMEALRKQNLLDSEEAKTEEAKTEITPPVKKNNRLYMLAGVFGVLILILAVLVFTQMR